MATTYVTLLLDGILERNRRIRELVEVGAAASGNDLACGHLVLRAVYTVNGDQLAIAQVTGAETPRGWIPASYDGVVTLADSNDDHLQVVLVRPEPGHLVMHGRCADKVERGSSRLLEGVVDRLEAQVDAKDLLVVFA